MGKNEKSFEERIYVHEICLIGNPVYMKQTLPASVCIERLYEFSLISSGYVAEIIFDIISSDGGCIYTDKNIKIGEIHDIL